jgi:hypothetical protein
VNERQLAGAATRALRFGPRCWFQVLSGDTVLLLHRLSSNISFPPRFCGWMNPKIHWIQVYQGVFVTYGVDLLSRFWSDGLCYFTVSVGTQRSATTPTWRLPIHCSREITRRITAPLLTVWCLIGFLRNQQRSVQSLHTDQALFMFGCVWFVQLYRWWIARDFALPSCPSHHPCHKPEIRDHPR